MGRLRFKKVLPSRNRGSDLVVEDFDMFAIFPAQGYKLVLWLRRPLATFRRKISNFWIVADEVRKARSAGLAAGVI
jgi:hypothetical protein